MDQSSRGFFSPSKLKPAIFYIILIFIGSLFISIIFALMIGKAKGLDTTLISNSYFSDIEVSDEINQVKLVASCYGNFTSYGLALIAIIIWMRNDFIEDFKSLQENKKFFGFYIPIAAVLFAIIAIVLDLVFTKICGESNNQSSIIEMIHSNGAVPIVISTILFAPIVEEMIYRKAIFSVMKGYPVWIPYLTSSFLFALPHMLSTSISQVGFGIWILELVPYLACGALLCLVYHKGKFNIYASIAAHMLNNILAVIMALTAIKLL